MLANGEVEIETVEAGRINFTALLHTDLPSRLVEKDLYEFLDNFKPFS